MNLGTKKVGEATYSHWKVHSRLIGRAKHFRRNAIIREKGRVGVRQQRNDLATNRCTERAATGSEVVQNLLFENICGIIGVVSIVADFNLVEDALTRKKAQIDH
jgi:hypothetical protein